MLNKPLLRRAIGGLVACAVVTMPGISRAQGDYASAVLAQNPVTYYRLNETAQPPAPDMAVNAGSLGASADGYYVGGAIHPEPGALVGEAANTAASFAGGARVAVPYQPELNPAGAFTVECWAYKDAGSGYPLGTISALQYAGGAERRGWLIYDNDASWQFRMGDGAGYVVNIGGGTATVGAWYHLVGVYNGTEAILYVNGAEVARVAPSRPFVPNPSVAMDIGSASAFGRHFAGVLDEVAIYPSALTAADVQAHYDSGTNPSPPTPYSQLVQAHNPLGYWRLSEPAYNPPTVLPTADNLGSSGATGDGSYNPGMEPGVPGSSFTGFGVDNKAGGFNGLVGHVGTPTTLNNLAQFTVMGWIKRGTAHSTRGGYFGQNDLLEFGDAGGGASIEAWINAYGANIVVPYPFEDDQWGFIALVGDGTKAVLYANGLPIATRSGTVASYGSSAYNFNIGGGGIFNATGDYFLGSVDEVAVFDKALSAQQVLDIFSAANVPPWITGQPVAPTRELYAGNPVTVSVTAAGPGPLSYQWRRDGVDLAGQTSADLVFAHITEGDTGSYDVVVSNNYGQATSNPVSLLVNPAETTAPTLLYATGSELFDKVRVSFSEPLDPVTAQNTSNYQLSGGLTISSATLAAPAGTDGDHIVELVTSTQTPGQIYTLTVGGVTDQTIPANTIAAGSTVEFSAWVVYAGHLKFEIWNGLSTSDNSLHNTLLADPRYPDYPDSTTLATAFNSRTVYADDTHEGYGGRMSGLLIPTETANYQFFLRSDDSSELYLSTSANPLDAVMIAEETDCCDAFVEQDQANDDGTTYATSFPAVRLEAGQHYYIAAAWKEGTGGDYCQVAWRKDTDSTPAGQLTPIGPEYLAVVVDPNVDMVFVTQPTDQVGILPSTGIEFYSQNFNANDGGFTVVNTDPAPPGPWVYDGSAGQWVADGAESGCTGPYNSQLSSPPITVTQDGTVSLSFSHRYSFEGDLWDAGQVRISVNGGSFTLVPAGNFSANGYAEGVIQGSGIANGQRAFNGDSPGYASGEFITSTALLGTFRQNDTVTIQFLGAWDDCTTGSVPGWVIDSLQLELVPMMILDFADNDGGFTVENDPPTPPGAWGPWIYAGTEGQWAADGSDTECGGPFNSRLTSPAYTVPQTDEVTLSFTHRYRFEGDLWDGGQVRISVNGGAFTPVTAEQFSANGYAPGTIQGNGILNGQRAFNGDSAGYENGQFIQSSAVLGQFNQGDTIAIQFVGGWDDCWSPGQPGWVIQGLQLAFGKAAQVSTFACDVSALLQGEPLAVSYQWQRNDGAGWADIPYANGASYSLYPTPADFGALFRVVATVPGKSIVSNEVKLLTEAVTEPEISITAAGNVITVTFSGTLQSATSVDGTYTDVQGAQSPYEITDPTGSLFLRSVR